MNSAEPVDMLRNWIGLDQGDKISRYCILNEFSKVVERGSVGTRKEDLKRKFASYAGSVIAIEVGTHSPWISRLSGCSDRQPKERETNHAKPQEERRQGRRRLGTTCESRSKAVVSGSAPK